MAQGLSISDGGGGRRILSRPQFSDVSDAIRILVGMMFVRMNGRITDHQFISDDNDVLLLFVSLGT